MFPWLLAALLASGTYQGTEHRNSGVIYQTSEVTCGAAALATLIVYHLDGQTTEEEMFDLSTSISEGEKPLIGTNLYGLREGARAKGYPAESYQLTALQLRTILRKTSVPVLVRMVGPTKHFCLVSGLNDEHVSIIDPVAGNVVISRKKFEEQWTQEALVVLPKAGVRKTGRSSEGADLTRLKESHSIATEHIDTMVGR